MPNIKYLKNLRFSFKTVYIGGRLFIKFQRMSRLSTSYKQPFNEASEKTEERNNAILLQCVPRPRASDEYDSKLVLKQTKVLKEFRESGKDLFVPNETRCVTKAGNKLYQTNETYGSSLSIEDMVNTMNDNELTLRVNFKRHGLYSNHTCMELSSKTLSTLMKDSPDDKGQKTVELRIKPELSVENPAHGAMFVSIVEKGDKHFLSHVDYQIRSAYDEMYHSG